MDTPSAPAASGDAVGNHSLPDPSETLSHGRPFRRALVDPLFELWIAAGRHWLQL
jgi:hypothetical protein